MSATRPPGGFLSGKEKVRRRGFQLWREPDGSRYCTWDALHGEVEVYNGRGRHLGALDPETGATIKEAVRGRKIEL